MQADSKHEFYFQGIYPVEVLERKDSFVCVRALVPFLFGCCRVRVGEVVWMPRQHVWKYQRKMVEKEDSVKKKKKKVLCEL